MSKRRINQYTCWECGERIITVDIDEGVTPAMLACRATDECGGTMHSHRYQVEGNPTPTYEWYKEKGRIKDQEMRKYIERGGLVLREIS